MGDIGIDRWVWKMNEHIRKGHHIIRYDEINNNGDAQEIEQQRLFKEEDFSATKTIESLSKRFKDEKLGAET